MSGEGAVKDSAAMQTESRSNSTTTSNNATAPIDKPDFLTRPNAMSLKSTTDIDTNPVLSNISLPNKIFTGTTAATASTTNVTNEVSSPVELTRSNDSMRSGVITPRNPSNAVAARIPSRQDIARSMSPLAADSKKGTAFPFTLSNDPKQKRSSTYASKSTVTAIPIAKKQNNNNSNYIHTDNESPHSRSSSMTASLSRSFLFGFYHDNRRSKQTPKPVLSKEYWMKDESSRECFTCGKPFTTFRRKHHCRICGQIFCNSCTLQIPADKFGFSGTMRVCHSCFEQANNYEDSSDDDLDTLDETGQVPDHSLLRSNLNLAENDNHSSDSLPETFDEPEALTESPNKGKQNEIFLLNNDDVQSIITTGEDSKLFVSTPPPPPKMAIATTRQGESLEIPLKHGKSSLGHNNNGKKIVSPNSNMPHNRSNLMKYSSPSNSAGYNRDMHTLRDISLMRTPSSSPFKKGSLPSNSDGNYNPGYHIRNKPSASRLGRSIFNYVTSSSSGPPDVRSSTPIQGSDATDSPDHARSIIGNLTNKNFKFKFNYGQMNPVASNEEQEQDKAPDEIKVPVFDDTREDEGTMSIYSSLNDAVRSDNPIRSTRNSTKSFQRAEASLQRMRNRRKSKSKMTPMNIYRDLKLLTHSTPNLLSVVSDTDSTDLALKLPSYNQDDNNTISSRNATPQPLNSPFNEASVDDTTMAPLQKIQTKSATNSNSSSSLSLPKHNSGKMNTFNHWKRLSSVSGLRYQHGNRNVLNEVATLHFKELLIQVLNDQDIGNTDEWLKVLENMALTKIQNITLSARDSNTLDYRQKYVKIKRISGGSISDSECIDGVVFAKALPTRDMPRSLDNPRILLVMFPLEYQRNENQLLSIESVFAQEKEYLNKLVGRLTSLHPDIIFVGANVSGYALELLNKARIVVQFNMKPQVIERIARLTEADIAISIDKLASNVKMGECASFEVKSYIYGNVSRTYTFLRGCNSSLGSTILLRGDTADNLRKIKHVAEFMVYVEFSLKLESSFFNDNFIQLSTNFYLQQKMERDDNTFIGYFADFLEKLNKRILTVSPTVEFPIPFLLKRARNIEESINNKIIEYDNLDDKNENIESSQLTDLDIKSTLTMTDLRYITRFIKEREIEDLKLQFKRKSRQWEVSYSLSNNLLGTGSHQSITVLYSMVSTKTATPCIDPQLVTVDYFWETDISIGQFIENVVSTAWMPCDGGCNGLLFDHYRSYVHGSGKVDVLIEKFQTKLPKLKNVILTWSYCKKCGTSTPILQLSEKTWNYSFGKYLEVMFWSKKGSLSDIGKCEHDFTKDHVKYFGYNDLVVRMEYSDLEIYELLTPPPKINWKPKVDIKMKVELYYQLLDKINMFYESVINRLVRVKLDSVSDEKVQSGEEIIDQLKSKVENEKRVLFTELEAIYRETPGDSHLGLNSIVKKLYDCAVQWDMEFNYFGKTFLPSETDISRITTNQLKKLFSDATDTRNNSSSLSIMDEKPHDIPLENKLMEEEPGETAVDQIASTNQHEPTIAPPSDDTTANLNVNGHAAQTDENDEDNTVQQIADETLTTDVTGSRNVQSNIANDEVTSNRSMSMHHTLKDNKVGKLATFFDQMHLDAISKEFELQRELQRKKLNASKFQGLKGQTLSPIVEIYKDVNDAVEEPLHAINNEMTSSKLGNAANNQKDGIMLPDGQLNQNLENELEHSISQWGQRIMKKDETTNVNPANNSTDVINATSDNRNSEPLPPIITTTTASKDDTPPPAPEKSILMKALTNFWADRSPYLWKPLSYPTLATEHVFSDNNVIIREDEPSSLIAFCLNTTDYKTKIRKMEIQQKKRMNMDVYNMEGSQNGSSDVKSRDGTLNQPSFEKESHISRSDADESVRLPDEEIDAPSSSFHQDIVDDRVILESIMTKKTAVHLRYQFEDELTVMSCKLFFTEHFDAFRRICNCGDNFVQSLSRCIKWDSSGGKSGSGFLKTLDDRFVIKELSHSELDAFIKFAPSYFEYMAQAMFHDLPTALAKVFGFYQIQIKSSVSGAKSYKMDVIIMENLFYETNTTRIFDLKGSMRNRHVEQTGKENEVLLDENMVEYIYESPIHVREYDKKLLRASLWNDTLFLAKMNVMDYSLVVGIDNDNYSLVVGIIDFIRTFTWDKKLESWVKEKGLVGGGNSSIVKQPTVVTPRQYKNRFREAMERYILMVPDPWFQETN